MKILITSLLLFISLSINSQEDRISTFTYNNKLTKTVDTLRISKKLEPMFFNFIYYAELYKYEYRNRLSDIEGIYYSGLSSDRNAGQTFIFEHKKDYVIVNDNLVLTEILNIIVFHELFHLFANSGKNDHCYGIDKCSSIMAPYLDGNIGYTLSNWEIEVAKLFAKLKAIENGKQEDYITECKIFSTGKF